MFESHYAFPAPNKIHMHQRKRFETKIIQLCKVILLTYLRGGSVTEQLECWTCSSEAPSSSPALTTS